MNPAMNPAMDPAKNPAKNPAAREVPPMRGVIAPMLTPFEADGRICRTLFCDHGARLLQAGAHYLSPFGTTGEALSVAPDRRMEAVEWLVAAGIAPARLMPGTGLTDLEGTQRLSAHARDLGAAAVMVVPSFFYTAAGDSGQARYFSALIERLAAGGAGAPRICLYNIPGNTGVPVTPALAAALNRDFPEVVVAYKDSSGDFDNTAAVITAAPALAVFPGSEAFMSRAHALGGAGCISATLNLNAAAIRARFEGLQAGRNEPEAEARMQAFRAAVQRAGLIGAMKAVLAVTSGRREWLNLLPPLADATTAVGDALLAELGDLAAHLRPGEG